MSTTETSVIERRDQKHARQVAEGIIEIFNELGLQWITGSYTYDRAINNDGDERAYAACAVGAMRVKAGDGRAERVGPATAGRELFGLTSYMCDGIIDGNDYGQSSYATLDAYRMSNCYLDEPMASCRQKYNDYQFGVKIGTRVRFHFRGE